MRIQVQVRKAEKCTPAELVRAARPAPERRSDPARRCLVLPVVGSALAQPPRLGGEYHAPRARSTTCASANRWHPAARVARRVGVRPCKQELSRARIKQYSKACVPTFRTSSNSRKRTERFFA